ncbi:hypothetical protein NC651_000781 [Populus alba x Populus x berolinensis]|nr:hypothetical protein NC651_000781 [Populus alba x Populus x berolinensis]
MVGALPGESSQYGNSESGPSRSSQDRPEEGGRWDGDHRGRWFNRKDQADIPEARRCTSISNMASDHKQLCCMFLCESGRDSSDHLRMLLQVSYEDNAQKKILTATQRIKQKVPFSLLPDSPQSEASIGWREESGGKEFEMSPLLCRDNWRLGTSP